MLPLVVVAAAVDSGRAAPVLPTGAGTCADAAGAGVLVPTGGAGLRRVTEDGNPEGAEVAETGAAATLVAVEPLSAAVPA